MRSSWADAVEGSGSGSGSGSAANSNASGGSAPQRFPANSAVAGGSAPQRPTKSSYVPPHLRNRPPPSEASSVPAPSTVDTFPGPPRQSGYGVPPVGGRLGGGVGRDMGRPGFGGGGRSGGGGGWNTRTGGWDRGREREVNPFENDDDSKEPSFEEENTGINFDAYEDIPVETSGGDVPPPVNTFAEIDLGDSLNENIRRCKYVKPTPVQRHAIPISLAGRDLMACAQTGSGKTAAFCFPIICGIMKGPPSQRPRGMRTVYPQALILSPTRELSVQVGCLHVTLFVEILMTALSFPSSNIRASIHI